MQPSSEVGDGHLYHYAFPTAVTRSSAGSWAVRWTRGAIGPLTALDRRNFQPLMEEARPKLFLVTEGRPRQTSQNTPRRHWVGALPPWLSELHDACAASLRLVLVEPSDAAFLRHFGLTRDDAPTAVLHDTHADRRCRRA